MNKPPVRPTGKLIWDGFRLRKKAEGEESDENNSRLKLMILIATAAGAKRDAKKRNKKIKKWRDANVRPTTTQLASRG